MTELFVVPENPGTSITLVGEETVRPPASIASTAAVAGSGDWGPANDPTLVGSFGEFESVFGNSDTDLRDAVLGAFLGTGIPGSPGAGAVLVNRIGVASGGGALDSALLTIQNTTPADALTLTARHPGTRGNRLSAVIEPDPADPTNRDRLKLLLDDVTVEKYTYPNTDVDALADAINNRPSKYVTAESLITGVVLTDTAGSDLVGGLDGTPLTATEYGAALDALEFEPFSILAFANLTDTAIHATVVSWAAAQAEAMRPVMVVLGGASGETLDAAVTRTAAYSDEPHVVSLGAGTFTDDFMDKIVGTAKLTPRVAGILAGFGEQRALTFAPLAGLGVSGDVEVTTDRLREASDAGVTAFRLASHPEADLVINRGVTAFIDPSNAAMPLEVFSEPRFIRIIDLFIRRVKEWGDANIVALPNTDDTRAAVKDRGQEELGNLTASSLIVNTPTVPAFFRVPEPDPERPDAIFFEFGWKFTPTTNYLVGIGRVR